MADNSEVTSTPAAAAETKKVKKATSVKKPKAKANHPPIAQMVDAAIKTLKERGGSSLLAVKKYLAANYKVDADKLAPFIKKYLKGSVEKGHLIQTKGKGASGSFKLSAAKKETKPKAKKVEKKKTVKKAAAKKSAAGEKKKKPASAKKPSGEKKKAEKTSAKAAKSTGTVKTKSSKQKSTKPSKSAAKKPKAPKPKKASSPKKAAAKKAKK